MDRFHGKEPRGEYAEVEGPPQSPTTAGRFGRMFRRLPVFLPGGGDEGRAVGFLRELAEGMRDDGDASGDNDDIPAGYTYVGQFVDHDITFDPTSSLQRANDPQGLHNFRTPRLDLDSVYGRGPADSPYLYDRGSEGNLALLVGKAQKDDGTDAEDDDLPRNRQGRALIGDPRNDENTFVGQFQLSMIKFHNRVLELDDVSRLPPGGGRMKEAQRIVRWHYQWAVLHDFLPRIVGDDIANEVVLDGGKIKRGLYEPRKNPYMPVEFSVAAYRFGHSQVRGTYTINNTVPERPTFSPDPDAGRLDDFRGFRPLPPQWTVSWPFFFELDDDGPAPTRLIDTKLSAPLFTLPGEPAGEQQNLALRNLLRGLRMRLPDGIRVAKHIGADPLTADELGFNEPPPLWYYVLKEAEVQNDGRHLGQVGGTIVAQVIAGLVELDPLSYLSVEPTWTPTLPSEDDGDFTFPDLLRFAVPEQASRF